MPTGETAANNIQPPAPNMTGGRRNPIHHPRRGQFYKGGTMSLIIWKESRWLTATINGCACTITPKENSDLWQVEVQEPGNDDPDSGPIHVIRIPAARGWEGLGLCGQVWVHHPRRGQFYKGGTMSLIVWKESRWLTATINGCACTITPKENSDLWQVEVQEPGDDDPDSGPIHVTMASDESEAKNVAAKIANGEPY